MSVRPSFVVAAAVLSAAGALATAAQETPLIPRAVLFGNPDRALTPFEEIKGPDGKPIMQPNGKPLRPAAQIAHVSVKFPDTIVVALNNRNPEYHDLFTCNIKTGDLRMLAQNDEFADITVDDDYAVRIATRPTPGGGIDILVNKGQLKSDGKGAVKAKWDLLSSIPFADALTTQPGGFDKTGNILYLTESRGRNTAALTAIDLTTGKTSVIAENPKADVGGVLAHPTEKTVQAVAFNYLRTEWTVLDKSIEPDLAYLKTVADGEINVGSRSQDDSLWIVGYLLDNGPVKVYLYDRKAKKATFLFSNRKALEGLPLAKMHAFTIKTRDGLDMVSYLTLPVDSDTDGDGRPSKPLPTVLLVHGGPWARDAWGLNGEHQWLANRGYAVLSVNFRGSVGFGKDFVNAGNKEWAAKMHDDLIDAVNWATAQKVADPRKVAIMGGSYGGYATLVGLTFTPETFACGVDIVGPSSITTLLNSIPPYWASFIEQMAERVGDWRTDEGRKFLETRSPLSRVDQIKRPLLIGQGANDPRVKQAEADQIVAAMTAKKIPVTYVLFPDEGHGFARPENRKAFNAVVEAFLAEHLGGRVEPIGEDFNGSSIQVPAGAEGVKGLNGALKSN
jgi:dipeptidyl aminopeptidase/acylaminoacyl peptidase